MCVIWFVVGVVLFVYIWECFLRWVRWSELDEGRSWLFCWRFLSEWMFWCWCCRSIWSSMLIRFYGKVRGVGDVICLRLLILLKVLSLLVWSCVVGWVVVVRRYLVRWWMVFCFLNGFRSLLEFCIWFCCVMFVFILISCWVWVWVVCVVIVWKWFLFFKSCVWRVEVVWRKWWSLGVILECL